MFTRTLTRMASQLPRAQRNMSVNFISAIYAPPASQNEITEKESAKTKIATQLSETSATFLNSVTLNVVQVKRYPHLPR